MSDDVVRAKLNALARASEDERRRYMIVEALRRIASPDFEGSAQWAIARAALKEAGEC